MPNSGLVHRVGTCRSSVRMARALAQANCLVLRLDLANLGDSGPRLTNEKMTADQRSVQELSTAIDQVLAQYGARPVIMYGLCSGSQNGFKLAVQDVRILGLFGIDHFGFQNWSHRLVHYARQCCRLQPWLNKIRQLFGVAVKPALDYDFSDGEFEWQYPAKQEIEAGYRQLVERQVKMRYIYTGDWRSEYNHRQQFFLMHKSVDFKGLATIFYKPKMSHILAEPSAQDFVEQQLIQFVSEF